jgi:hypothetical protein
VVIRPRRKVYLVMKLRRISLAQLYYVFILSWVSDRYTRFTSKVNVKVVYAILNHCRGINLKIGIL